MSQAEIGEIVRIVYAHHNCFVIQGGGATLVFDYPHRDHRTEGAEAVVARALEGAEAYVFVSHSHADHCSDDVIELARQRAASVRWVLSFDVPEMVPAFEGLPDSIVVDPDEGRMPVADGITVQGLDATDLGVAFLIDTPWARIAFNGDLAEWAWQALDERARQHEIDYFTQCLEQLRDFGPDVVLANTDPRLPSWGGATRLVETLRPPVFVPMHAFGRPSLLTRWRESLGERPGTRMFAYEEPGDVLEARIPARSSSEG
jgi:L-ascorbate metabolism protein UlaG (beta-lactamase superfamily)